MFVPPIFCFGATLWWSVAEFFLLLHLWVFCPLVLLMPAATVTFSGNSVHVYPLSVKTV